MNRYAVKHYAEVLAMYRDKEWAIHSAQCHADFYKITVALVDTKTGEVISVNQPRFPK